MGTNVQKTDQKMSYIPFFDHLLNSTNFVGGLKLVLDFITPFTFMSEEQWEPHDHRTIQFSSHTMATSIRFGEIGKNKALIIRMHSMVPLVETVFYPHQHQLPPTCLI